MDLLQGKVALVTGGSSGNGRAIALAFSKQGASVVIADIREEPREGGLPTTQLIKEETGGRVEFVSCNVGSMADLESAVEAAEAMGGIEILVNNAGILIKEGILEATEEAFDRIMQVNVRGTFFGTQIAAKRMVGRRRGAIINLSSVAGFRGTAGYAAYNLSKGAVRMMTASFADELGPYGIRVNAVYPGIINTQMNIVDDKMIGTEQGEGYLPMIPARRWGEASDVADACVFLASDLSSYVLGAGVVVDGGYLRL